MTLSCTPTFGFAGIAAFATLLLASGPASAQANVIDEVWQKFTEHCAPIMQARAVDVDAFMNLPPEHRIAVSTDGKRIQIDHQTQDQRQSLGVMQSDLGERRFIDCNVGYHNLQPIGDFEAVAAELRQRLEVSGVTAIAGGEDDVLKITSIYASEGSGLDKTVLMDVLGLFPDPNIVTNFQVYSYGIAISALAIFPMDGQTSDTFAQTPEPDTTGPAATMRAVLEACLRNYPEPKRALPALEAAGMTLSPTGDLHSWEMSGEGVFGNVDVSGEIYCSIQSQSVPLETAQAIGTELANSLFPNLVQPGAPEGGNGPCDGLSIFAPRQMLWLRYAHAGNSGECINDGTSAIILN